MISIVIPIYNGIEFLETSLASVIIQTYCNWELIIGINGHPKNSHVELKANEIVNLYNPENLYKISVNYYETKGKPATLNKMIHDCNYDFIAILDVDDYWLPTKLEEQLPYLKDYDVIGTHCKYFGDSNHSPTIPFGDLKDFNFFYYNPIINSSAIIKKELAHWTDDFFGMDDYDLWLKLFCDKKKFFNLHQILCYHRIYSEIAFNSKKEQEENLENLKKKWFMVYMNK